MGKQYTFKTTKDTEWLQSVLDSMNSRERSEFIRSAIIAQLTKTSCIEVDRQSLTSNKRSDNKSDNDLGVQEMPKFNTLNVSDQVSDLDMFDEVEEQDLDSILDNINF